MINKLKLLSEDEYIYIVKAFLKKMELDLIKEDFLNKDNVSTNMKVKYNNPIAGGDYLIFINLRNKNIKETTLDNLLKQIIESNCVKGIFFTMIEVSNEIKNMSLYKRIEIIDMEKLSELIHEYEIDIDKELRDNRGKDKENNNKLEGEENKYQKIETTKDIISSIEENDIKIADILEKINKRIYSSESENILLRLKLISLLYFKYQYSSSKRSKKIIFEEIMEQYSYIEDSPYIKNIEELNDVDEWKYLNSIFNALKETISILRFEFSDFVCNYLEISSKFNENTLKNYELLICYTINIIHICEWIDRHGKSVEILSLVENRLTSEIEEKESAIREIDFEIRKISKEKEELNVAVKKVSSEKMNSIYNENIEIIDILTNKLLQDIDILSKEYKKSGTIKKTGLFMQKISDEELKTFISMLIFYAENIPKFKKILKESFIVCKNNSLLEYKHQVLNVLLKKLIECNVEKEIFKNKSLFLNGYQYRLAILESISDICCSIDENQEIILSKECSNVSIPDYPIEKINNEYYSKENLEYYLLDLEKISSNIENQIKYLKKWNEFLLNNIEGSDIFILDLNNLDKFKNVSFEDLTKVDIKSITYNFDVEYRKSEIRKLNTLLDMFRFL